MSITGPKRPGLSPTTAPLSAETSGVDKATQKQTSAPEGMREAKPISEPQGVPSSGAVSVTREVTALLKAQRITASEAAERLIHAAVQKHAERLGGADADLERVLRELLTEDPLLAEALRRL